jgi:phage terminase large subunit-like protein
MLRTSDGKLKSKNYLKATGVEVQAHKIVHTDSNSFVRAMAADSNGLDGLNDIVAIMDELHAMDRKLFDVVYSGMSKRRDSLMLCITTAGFNNDSVGYSQSVYAKKVAKGETEDDQFFSIIFTIDEGDDIYSEVTWKKANPSYGYSVDPVTFEAKAKKARETPSDLPNFKVKHLNIWLSEAKAFFDVAAWDRCADPSLKIEDFYGKKCYAGIDLASKIDLTSFAYVFREEGIYYIFDKTFIPEKTVDESRNTMYDNCIGNSDT